MLPYKVNELTDAIRPLKMKEYLATGKPVITTPIKEASRLRDYVIIAERIDEWEKSIRNNIKGISLEEYKKREIFLKNESWVNKTGEFLRILIQGD